VPVPDYEVEYNNGRRVAEVDAISARWEAASASYRETADAELDRRYGPGDRNRYDLFFTGSARAPLVVYVHGGYWQWGDRTLFSFLAEGLNANGLSVAIPSYSLCPTVSVLEIVGELRSLSQSSAYCVRHARTSPKWATKPTSPNSARR